MNASNTSLAAAGPPKVLVVDDMDDARWVLSNLLRQEGFMPLVAANGKEALACIQQEIPDLVLLDVGLPDLDGFEVLARAKAQDKTLPVIMVTGHGKTQDAVRAMRAGAWDYVAKPFKNEDVILTARCALEERLAKRQVRRISSPCGQADFLMNTMGNSASIQALQREVERVAKTNFSVLVTGESGTGKELVSQAIHAQSLRGRAIKPLVAVDCGAISESLIESELFGHEKGAFTGAYQAKVGAFELADGGTIFLDEVGNLPLAMQGKLLRVLEARKIHRIGGINERNVDFRVVAATNANLREMVDKKQFRGDLYHRLAEYTICIPPLRRRKEDLRFLVNRFRVQANQELGKQVPGVSIAAWALIQQYSWPGNARELRNQLRRAMLLSEDTDGKISPEVLGIPGNPPPDKADRAEYLFQPDPPQLGGCESSHHDCPLCDSKDFLASKDDFSLKEITVQVVAQVERSMLVHVLTLTQGNKAEAARMLHIDYTTMHHKLKTHQICATQFMKNPYGAEAVES